MKSALRKKWPVWLAVAAVCLGLHYLVMILCRFVINGGFSLQGFSDMFWQRLTEPGDATRYLDIAENGYVTEGENQINLVFYPLYPLLVRVLSFLTGSLPAAGIVVSQVCYAVSSVLLYELILADADARRAWDGALLMALYPFSTFVMGVFSEGLFLMLTIGALLALRRDRMLLAGIIGFFAALSRTQGMLLFFPAVYRWIQVCFLAPEKRKPRFSDLCLLLIPLGFVTYLCINYALHGGFFKFLQYEAAAPWYQSAQWVGSNIAQHYGMAQDYGGLAYVIYYVQIALYFVVLGILILGAYKKESLMYLLYGGVYLGFSYLSGWMISGGRYMLGCVPVFIILARREDGLMKRLIFAASALMFFTYSLFFYQAHAIM